MWKGSPVEKGPVPDRDTLAHPPSDAELAKAHQVSRSWLYKLLKRYRRHSSRGYLSPNEYEAVHSKETQAAFS
jgi:hypothetical protein